jgi:hypothetical protein
MRDTYKETVCGICLYRMKLQLFESSVRKWKGIKLGCREHSNLKHHMSESWMTAMFEWLPKAWEELQLKLRLHQVDWCITRHGSVMAELELKGKPTQLILYRSVEIDDEWLITIEALHYDKHAPF